VFLEVLSLMNWGAAAERVVEIHEDFDSVFSLDTDQMLRCDKTKNPG
jgi:hypothetical protein